jgi:hypothetical protein
MIINPLYLWSKAMSKKEWIGKVRIYLGYRKSLYKFCWISMEKDNSLLFGFSSKTFRFIEYGSSVVRAGYFTDESPILTRGNINVKDAKTPHITFHPPRLYQKSGLVHMIDENGRVDEWELDWFPVKKPNSLLFAYTGSLLALDRETKPKGKYQVVVIPPNLQCLRMELILFPNLSPQTPKVLHRPDAVGNVHGLCVNYIVSCYFYPNPLGKPAVFIAA